MAAVLVVLGWTAGDMSATGRQPSRHEVAAPAGRPAQATAAAQVTRSERADVTFELRPAAAGGVVLDARSGDLQVTKTVQGTGEFVLEIAVPRDRVSIAVTGQATSVARGKTSVVMPRSAAAQAEAVRIRRLVADSEAVLRFRGLVAALIEADDRSHQALALVIADAAVGLLAGDVGAPGRTARLLGNRVRGGVRPAAMAVDCFTLMETRMVEAYNDFGSCYYSTAYNPFYQSLCSWRWTVQVESYWFNFLSCSGFSFS